MKKLLPLTCIAALALPAGADEKPKADDAKEKLKGSWVVVSAERNGEQFPEKEFKGTVLTFEGDKLLTKKDKPEETTYKIDATRKPAHRDVVLADGPQKGETAKLIYQLDGDTLKIARGVKPVELRPKGFDEKDLMILTLKREKK